MGLYKKLFKKKLGASSRKANSHSPETPRPQQTSSETENAQSPSDTLQSSDLWKKAASQLLPKDQAKLGALLKTRSAEGHGDPTIADIDLVISRAKELDDGARQTPWRPILDKIVKAALAVKKVGDAAAELDKSGYAAIGWSVVSVGLQVAVNAQAARQFVLSSSEFTTALLTRYVEYETELRGPHAGDEFDHRVTDVYKAILLYVLALDDFLRQCTAGRIGHAFSSIDDRTISQRKMAVMEADDFVKEWIPIIALKSRKHDMSQVHEKLNAGLKILSQTNEDSVVVSPAAQKCSRSLAFDNMDERFGSIETATEGTCNWLFQHQMYQDWAKSMHGLLWIRGKPGSGKSTLLRHVLDESLSDSSKSPMPCNDGDGTSQPPVLVLFFFFHGRGVELQKTPMGLFRTLLHQLLRHAPDTLEDLVAAYEDRCKTRGDPGKGWQWQLRELKDFLTFSLRKILERRPVHLFVDALDEAGRDNAVGLVSWFKTLLKSFTSKETKFPCRVCFTCRHYPILSLDGGFQICVEQENKQDISTYVYDRLSESQIPPELVMQRAGGVILWCRLVLDKLLLLELDADNNFEEEIERIPPDLDSLYLTLLDRMDRRGDSLRLMQWICFSSRPLSLDELRWAMFLDSHCQHQTVEQCEADHNYTSDDDMMKRKLRRLSCGLVETVSSMEGERRVEIVQVIHQSVKDFFVNDGLSSLMTLDTTTALCSGSKLTPSGVSSAAHYEILRTCLRYLSLDMFGGEGSICILFMGPEKLLTVFHFCSYAMTQWIYHATNLEEDMQADILDFFAWPSDDVLQKWVQLYLDTSQGPECPVSGTALQHIAAQYGLAGLLRAIIERAPTVGSKIDIDQTDFNSQTAFLWTARNGHEACARLLLDSGKVDADCSDNQYYTPLAWAARNGHTSVMQLILSRPHDEIDVNFGNYIGFTPLSQAAYYGHDDAVEILLKIPETDVDAKDCYAQTPLLLAASEGQEAVVQRLLHTEGVDADTEDSNGWTPLVWAARNGHMSIVSLLLDSGRVEVEKRDQWGRTVLSWAAEYGRAGVARELIGHGKADINTKDNDGATPLWWAAKESHVEMVKTLVRYKTIEVDAKENEGRTALFMAAKAGSETVVRLLLETGRASVDATTQQGETPLSIVTSEGHTGVMKLLQDFGATSVAAEQPDSPLLDDDDTSTVVGESLTTVNSFASFSKLPTTNDSSTVMSKLAALDNLKIINNLAVAGNSKMTKTSEDDDFVLVSKHKGSRLAHEQPLLA